MSETMAVAVEKAVKERLAEVLTDDVVKQMVDAEILRLTTVVEVREYYSGRTEKRSPIQGLIQAEAEKIFKTKIAEHASTEEFRERFIEIVVKYCDEHYDRDRIIKNIIMTIFEPIFAKINGA